MAYWSDVAEGQAVADAWESTKRNLFTNAPNTLQKARFRALSGFVDPSTFQSPAVEEVETIVAFSLADIGWVAFGWIAFLIAVVIFALLTAISYLFPDVNAWFVHINLRSMVQGFFGTVIDWITQHTKSSWQAVWHTMINVGRLIYHGYSVLSGAIDVVAHKTDRLFFETIPQAEHAAMNYADGLDRSVRHDMAESIKTINDGIDGVRSDIQHFETVTVPTLISDVEGRISDLKSWVANTVEPAIDTRLAQLDQEISSGIAGIWSQLTPLENVVSQTIPKELQQLGISLNTQISNLAAKEAADAKQALATAAADLQAATHYADIATANTLAEATANLDQAKAAFSTALQASQVADGKALAAAQSTLQQSITGVSKELAPVATAATLTLPTAIAAIATTVASVQAKLDTCAVTQCDGPNNWQNVLKRQLPSLLSLLGDAAIIAFLAEAITHPEATGKAVVGTSEAIYSTGHDVLDALGL